MEFGTLGETATIIFDMATLEAIARACRVAERVHSDREREPYPFNVAACAFTAAAIIARVHGDMPAAVAERMGRVHSSLTEV